MERCCYPPHECYCPIGSERSLDTPYCSRRKRCVCIIVEAMTSVIAGATAPLQSVRGIIRMNPYYVEVSATASKFQCTNGNSCATHESHLLRNRQLSDCGVRAAFVSLMVKEPHVIIQNVRKHVEVDAQSREHAAELLSIIVIYVVKVDYPTLDERRSDNSNSRRGCSAMFSS